MALGERATGTGTRITIGSGTVTLTLTDSPVSGDLILAFVCVNGSSGDAHPAPSISGFTSLGSSTASSWNRLTVLGKIAAGTEGTSLSVTFTASADMVAVGALVISGADSSLPTNIITTPDASSDTTVSIPAITTVAANSWDVAAAGFGGNADYAASGTNYSAWGSSLSEKVDIAASNAGAEFAGVGIAYAARASAGTQAATSVTQSTADVASVIRLEVEEAGGAPTPTPPTFVAAGTAAFTATASATVTPGLPSGWAANDIHLLIASGNNNLDWPEPSGWTKLSPGAVAENNTAGMRVELWARRAVGGDSAPVLSTYTGTTVRGAQIVGIRGCPTTSTVDTVIAAMSRSNNASSTTATFATLTPGDDYTRIIALLAYQDNITGAVTLSGFSAFDVASGQRTNLGNDMALSYAHRTWSDGSVATGSLTSLTSGAAANVSVGILLAMEPVPLAGTTVDVSASPASAAGTAVNPTLTFSSVTVSATGLPASAAGTAVTPTVRQGSLTINATAAPATASGTAADPSVRQGSVTVTGASVPASASGTAITPAVVLGSLSVALSGLPAEAVGTAVDPTVGIAGGGLTVDLSAVPAAAAGTAPDPTVTAGGDVTVNLSAAPASAAGTAISPSLMLGSLTANASAVPASASGTAVDPSVRLGSLTVNLSAVQAAAAGTAVTPTVTVSGGGLTVNLSAVPAAATGSAVSPSVIQGSISIDVGAAAAVGTAIDPSVVQGSLALDLAALPATATGTAVTPTVVLVEAFDFPLSSLSVIARPGATSSAGRPGASSSARRATARSTVARAGSTSLATRPASTFQSSPGP